MTIETRIKHLEDSLSINNPLSQADRCQVINIPNGMDRAEKDKLIESERTRILEELQATYGQFDTDSITWIELVNFATQNPATRKGEIANEY
jgi:hypothetical protein